MKKAISTVNQRTAETIADLADQGEDISQFFTNKGKMMPPVHGGNTDCTFAMTVELDERTQ